VEPLAGFAVETPTAPLPEGRGSVSTSSESSLSCLNKRRPVYVFFADKYLNGLNRPPFSKINTIISIIVMKLMERVMPPRIMTLVGHGKPIKDAEGRETPGLPVVLKIELTRGSDHWPAVCGDGASLNVWGPHTPWSSAELLRDGVISKEIYDRLAEIGCRALVEKPEETSPFESVTRSGQEIAQIKTDFHGVKYIGLQEIPRPYKIHADAESEFTDEFQAFCKGLGLADKQQKDALARTFRPTDNKGTNGPKFGVALLLPHGIVATHLSGDSENLTPNEAKYCRLMDACQKTIKSKREGEADEIVAQGQVYRVTEAGKEPLVVVVAHTDWGKPVETASLIAELAKDPSARFYGDTNIQRLDDPGAEKREDLKIAYEILAVAREAGARIWVCGNTLDAAFGGAKEAPFQIIHPDEKPKGISLTIGSDVHPLPEHRESSLGGVSMFHGASTAAAAAESKSSSSTPQK
jgi:hypothetical protein